MGEIQEKSSFMHGIFPHSCTKRRNGYKKGVETQTCSPARIVVLYTSKAKSGYDTYNVMFIFITYMRMYAFILLFDAKFELIDRVFLTQHTKKRHENYCKNKFNCGNTCIDRKIIATQCGIHTPMSVLEVRSKN